MATIGAFDRLTVEPGKCRGKPCIRGMRITVRRVLELLASYPDRAALIADYPFLEPEDLNQALRSLSWPSQNSFEDRSDSKCAPLGDVSGWHASE
jgi:uncharacterized protein (DUF433 family)